MTGLSGFLFCCLWAFGPLLQAFPGDSSLLLQSRATLNAEFEDVTDVVFVQAPTPINEGEVSWGDFDADGDLDILAVGLADQQPVAMHVARIYENRGGQFFEYPANLEKVQLPTASWADIDLDGDLDILILGQNEGTFTSVARLYRNDNGNFVQLSTNIIGVFGSSADWGDYDQDGDPDLLLSGFHAPFEAGVCRVYNNRGNGVFTEINTNLPGILFGDVAWYDFDKDQDLDILLTGSDANGVFYSDIYENTEGQFVRHSGLSAALQPLSGGNLDLADFDGDGYLDVALAGETPGGSYATYVYRYVPGPNPTFSLFASLQGIKDGDVAWGDYNGDGFPDLLVTGLTSRGSSRTTRLYENFNANWFTVVDCEFFAVEKSAVDWGDYDQDGRLDLLLTGRTSGNVNDNTNRVFRLYRGKKGPSNEAPNPPGFASYADSSGTIHLFWGAGTDPGAQLANLTYNLRLGTQPGLGNIISPLALSDGSRLVAANGNAQKNTSWTIRNLPAGTYYWSVQAIDAGYEGSPFSSEQSFSIATGQPDYLPQIFSISPSSVCPGGTFTVQAAVTNTGNLAAGINTAARYYLSANTLLDGGDVAVGVDDIEPLAVQQSTNESETITLPPGTPAGSYFLLYVADAGQQLVESNEGNNLTFIPLTVKSIRLSISVVQPPTCTAAGSVAVSVIDGRAPYRYKLDSQGWQTLPADGILGGITANDIHNLLVQDADSCTASRSFSLAAPMVPSLELTPDDPTCVVGGSIRARVINAEAGMEPFSYFLLQQGVVLDSATSSLSDYTFRNLPAGSYELFVRTAANCRSSSRTAQLQAPNVPEVFISIGDDSPCQGSAPQLITANRPNGVWSANAPGGVFTPDEAGEHLITYSFTNNKQCTGTDSLLVKVLLTPEIAVLTQDPDCDGPGTIEVMVVNAVGGENFQYTLGNQRENSTAAQYTFDELAGGSYLVQVWNEDCASRQEVVSLREPERIPVSIDFPADTSLCVGSAAFSLLATPVGLGSWQGPVSSQGVFDPASLGPGSYTVSYQVLSDSVCSAPASVRIELLAIPALNLPSLDYEIRQGESFSLALSPHDQWWLELQNASTSAASSGQGSIQHAFQLVDPKAVGTATYRILPGNGICTGEEVVVRVEIIPVIELKIPEMITPNGDGFNDKWDIEGLEREQFLLQVYNQQGAKVFESRDAGRQWDGGRAADGVYWYLLEIQGRPPIKGAVLLQRERP